MKPELLATLNCPICGEHFNFPFDLIMHLAEKHAMTVEQIYTAVGFDKTQQVHRCLYCGKEWTLSKKQYLTLNYEQNHIVGCCRSHSAKLMAHIKKIGWCNSANAIKSHDRWLRINGTRSPFGSKEVQDKARAHWINDPNNGTNSPFGNREVQEKSQSTMIKGMVLIVIYYLKSS